MKAVHLICRRDGITLLGLSPLKDKKGYFQSCCWAFKDDPSSLIGGWAYLHPVSKKSPSEFGGVVREVLPAKREGKAIEDGYILGPVFS